MIRLKGTPVVLDAFLRPFVRAAQVVLGGGLSVALWLWGLTLAAPVPFLLAIVAGEVFFWWRGDRPVELQLGDKIRYTDKSQGHVLEIDPRRVIAVDLHHRPISDRHTEAVVMLTDEVGGRLGITFVVESSFRPRAEDVDCAAMDDLLGGYGGLLSTLAAPHERCRQRIVDPSAQGIRWLRANLPTRAWQRTVIRLWQGAAPELDGFAHFREAPHGTLLLDGDRYRVNLGGHIRSGTVALMRCANATRSAHLIVHEKGQVHGDFERTGELPTTEVELPLLLVELDEHVTLAMPAPVADLAVESRELSPRLLHTTVPEGGALLWHVLTRWPSSAWPAALRQRTHVPPTPTNATST